MKIDVDRNYVRFTPEIDAEVFQLEWFNEQLNLSQWKHITQRQWDITALALPLIDEPR